MVSDIAHSVNALTRYHTITYPKFCGSPSVAVPKIIQSVQIDFHVVPLLAPPPAQYKPLQRKGSVGLEEEPPFP